MNYINYIGIYDDAAAIQAALDAGTLANPYVALNDDTGELDYNGLEPTPPPRIEAVYDVQDIEWATPLYNSSFDLGDMGIIKVEADGVDITSNFEENPGEYQFSNTGEHTVYFTITGDTLGENPGTGETPSENGFFTGIEELKSVVFPDNLTAIGDSCFLYCGSLEEVHLPASLTRIGYKTFSGCEYLDPTTVFPLPSGVTYIGGSAFYNIGMSGIEPLTEITIPSGVTLGNSASGECMFGVNLCAVTFEEGVTSIPQYMFEGGNMAKAYLPSTLASIGSHAFGGYGFAEFWFAGSVPPTRGTDALGQYDNYTWLYVPTGATTAYLEATAGEDWQNNIRSYYDAYWVNDTFKLVNMTQDLWGQDLTIAPGLDTYYYDNDEMMWLQGGAEVQLSNPDGGSNWVMKFNNYEGGESQQEYTYSFTKGSTGSTSTALHISDSGNTPPTLVISWNGLDSFTFSSSDGQTALSWTEKYDHPNPNYPQN